MKPFFLRDTNNFGDYTNHWLWPRLIGDLLDEKDNMRLVGIGSLLKSDLNYVVGKKIIFGTGSGYGSFPRPDSMKDWMFYFVRGPLTAEKFGLSPEKAIVDGAWLVSLLPDFNGVYHKKGICFIPHWKTAERGDWEKVCRFAGIKYLDPLGDFESILNNIANSSLVITESLHGAIFADLFRTPWIPVEISREFLRFKWIDWCQSVEVPFRLIKIPPSGLVDCFYNKVNPNNVEFKIKLQNSPGVEEIKSGDVKITPPFYYKHLMVIKKMLRHEREKIFHLARKLEDVGVYRRWNDRYVMSLSVLLKDIALLEPSLSLDRIKNEKIEKLQNVLYLLKNDYKRGVLSD